MAKIDFVKYAALGAGAVAVPAFLGGMAFLASIPFLDTVLFQGITIGGIVLSGLGVGAVDQIFYGK